jgi:hypothetical protein
VLLQRAGVDRTGQSAWQACIADEAVDRQADYRAERDGRRSGGNSEIAARSFDEMRIGEFASRVLAS